LITQVQLDNLHPFLAQFLSGCPPFLWAVRNLLAPNIFSDAVRGFLAITLVKTSGNLPPPPLPRRVPKSNFNLVGIVPNLHYFFANVRPMSIPRKIVFSKSPPPLSSLFSRSCCSGRFSPSLFPERSVHPPLPQRKGSQTRYLFQLFQPLRIAQKPQFFEINGDSPTPLSVDVYPREPFFSPPQWLLPPFSSIELRELFRCIRTPLP